MIYEEKASNHPFRENPVLMQSLIDAIPIPLFYRDLNFCFQACNMAFEKFIGMTSETMAGKMAGEFLPADMTEVLEKRDNDLAEGAEDQIYEAKLKALDATVRDIIVQKKMIKNEQGEKMGSLGSIFDISDRKKAEQKLERARESMIISSHMLHKIGAGIVIINKNFKIIDSNESFAEMMGEETRELYETIPGLRGADISELVPEVINRMLSNIMTSGENNLERDVKFHNKLFHVSVITIYKQKVVGAVIRDMSAPMLVRDEIISRAQRVNKQYIETVQKIAFLMGENAAQTEELLNSIIQTYKYGDDE